MATYDSNGEEGNGQGIQQAALQEKTEVLGAPSPSCCYYLP